MKNTYVSAKSFAYGGIHKVIEYLKKNNFDKFVSLNFPKRKGNNAKYNFKDMILQLYLLNLMSLKNISASEEIRKSCLQVKYYNKHLGHDTLSRLIGLTTTEDVLIASPKVVGKGQNRRVVKEGVINVINKNELNNERIIKAGLHFHLLNPLNEYTLDIDSTLLFTKNSDAKMTYKMQKGYNPLVACINGIPIWIEGRNGNSSPKYNVLEGLKESIEMVEHYGLKISVIRIDNAGQNEKILKYLDGIGKKFYIRARKNKVIEREINKRISNGESFPIKITRKIGDSKFALVYERKKSVENDKERLFGIITNDFEMKKDKVIETYNKRTICEDAFRNLKQDFGWGKLPFKELSKNTAYLQLCALMYLLYKSMLKEFSILDRRKRFYTLINENIRLTTFITNVIKVVVTYIKNETRFEIDSDSPKFKLFNFLDKILI